MKKNDLLFVYGTLRLGEAADLSKKEFGNGISHATFVKEDRINGNLYDLGWFPGVKRTFGEVPFEAELPTVVGDVFRLDSDTIADQLDGYEGFPNLYGRSQVQTESGLIVWVYTYNGAAHPDRAIPSGDWKDHGKDTLHHVPILAD
jgi:gamma-glutamylcyclotransferase (GGCT)/AIG2-like uncharacterized protein YtfP